MNVQESIQRNIGNIEKKNIKARLRGTIQHVHSPSKRARAMIAAVGLLFVVTTPLAFDYITEADKAIQTYLRNQRISSSTLPTVDDITSGASTIWYASSSVTQTITVTKPIASITSAVLTLDFKEDTQAQRSLSVSIDTDGSTGGYSYQTMTGYSEVYEDIVILLPGLSSSADTFSIQLIPSSGTINTLLAGVSVTRPVIYHRVFDGSGSLGYLGDSTGIHDVFYAKFGSYAEISLKLNGYTLGTETEMDALNELMKTFAIKFDDCIGATSDITIMPFSDPDTPLGMKVGTNLWWNIPVPIRTLDGTALFPYSTYKVEMWFETTVLSDKATVLITTKGDIDGDHLPTSSEAREISDGNAALGIENADNWYFFEKLGASTSSVIGIGSSTITPCWGSIIVNFNPGTTVASVTIADCFATTEGNDDFFIVKIDEDGYFDEKKQLTWSGGSVSLTGAPSWTTLSGLYQIQFRLASTYTSCIINVNGNPISLLTTGIEDADGDGIPDGQEDTNLDRNHDAADEPTRWLSRDTDGDGLVDNLDPINALTGFIAGSQVYAYDEVARAKLACPSSSWSFNGDASCSFEYYYNDFSGNTLAHLVDGSTTVAADARYEFLRPSGSPDVGKQISFEIQVVSGTALVNIKQASGAQSLISLRFVVTGSSFTATSYDGTNPDIIISSSLSIDTLYNVLVETTSLSNYEVSINSVGTTPGSPVTGCHTSQTWNAPITNIQFTAPVTGAGEYFVDNIETNWGPTGSIESFEITEGQVDIAPSSSKQVAYDFYFQLDNSEFTTEWQPWESSRFKVLPVMRVFGKLDEDGEVLSFSSPKTIDGIVLEYASTDLLAQNGFPESELDELPDPIGDVLDAKNRDYSLIPMSAIDPSVPCNYKARINFGEDYVWNDADGDGKRESALRFDIVLGVFKSVDGLPQLVHIYPYQHDFQLQGSLGFSYSAAAVSSVPASTMRQQLAFVLHQLVCLNYVTGAVHETILDDNGNPITDTSIGSIEYIEFSEFSQYLTEAPSNQVIVFSYQEACVSSLLDNGDKLGVSRGIIDIVTGVIDGAVGTVETYFNRCYERAGSVYMNSLGPADQNRAVVNFYGRDFPDGYVFSIDEAITDNTQSMAVLKTSTAGYQNVGYEIQIGGSLWKHMVWAVIKDGIKVAMDILGIIFTLQSIISRKEEGASQAELAFRLLKFIVQILKLADTTFFLLLKYSQGFKDLIKSNVQNVFKYREAISGVITIGLDILSICIDWAELSSVDPKAEPSRYAMLVTKVFFGFISLSIDIAILIFTLSVLSWASTAISILQTANAIIGIALIFVDLAIRSYFVGEINNKLESVFAQATGIAVTDYYFDNPDNYWYIGNREGDEVEAVLKIQLQGSVDFLYTSEQQMKGLQTYSGYYPYADYAGVYWEAHRCLTSYYSNPYQTVNTELVQYFTKTKDYDFQIMTPFVDTYHISVEAADPSTTGDLDDSYILPEITPKFQIYDEIWFGGSYITGTDAFNLQANCIFFQKAVVEPQIITLFPVFPSNLVGTGGLLSYFGTIPGTEVYPGTIDFDAYTPGLTIEAVKDGHWKVLKVDSTPITVNFAFNAGSVSMNPGYRISSLDNKYYYQYDYHEDPYHCYSSYSGQIDSTEFAAAEKLSFPGIDSGFVEFWLYTTGATTIYLKQLGSSPPLYLTEFNTGNYVPQYWTNGKWQHVRIDVGFDGTNTVFHLSINGICIGFSSTSGHYYLGQLDIYPTGGPCYIDAIGCSWDQNYELGMNMRPLAPSETPLTFTDEMELSIVPGTPVDDFQVKVELGSWFAFDDCQFGGQDVRFFTLDGSSIPYWIESWSQSTEQALIWVKVPDKDTTSIIMKYGNADAIPESNGEAVFDFFDEFSDSNTYSDHWEASLNLHMNEYGGRLVMSANTGSTTGWEYLRAKTGTSGFMDPADGGIVEVRWTPLQSSGAIYMFQRLENADQTRLFGIYDQGLVGESSWIKGVYNEPPDNCVSLDPPLTTPGVYTWVTTRFQRDQDNTFEAQVLDTTWLHTFDDCPKLDLVLYIHVVSFSIAYDYVRARKYAEDEPVVLPFSRDITLSPGTPLDDYQVRIDLNAFNFGEEYGWCNQYGNDIRFLADDGTLLPYWIEKWNQDSSRSFIWVKVPDAGTTHLTMWFGSSVAVSKSDGKAVFDFFDDFSGVLDTTEKWESPTASTSVHDGRLDIWHTVPNGWGNLISKATIKSDKGGIAEIRWAAAEEGDLHIDHRLDLYTSAGQLTNYIFGTFDGYNVPTFSGHYKNGGSFKDLDGTSSYTQNPFLWSTLRLQRDQHNLFSVRRLNEYYAYLGPDVPSNWDMALGSSDDAKLTFSICYYSKKVAFDWIRIRKYSDVVPVATVSDGLPNSVIQEDFESYTVGSSLNGKLGPLGTWTAYPGTSGEQLVKIQDYDGGRRYRQRDFVTGTAVSSSLEFSTPGAVDGLNTIRWRQNILVGSYWWAVGFWEGTSGGSVGIEFPGTGGAIHSYVGDTSVALTDPKLTFTQGVWETYEVLFCSETQFKIRKNDGEWIGPFTNRYIFNDNDPVVTRMSQGGHSGTPYSDTFIDDITPSWMQPRWGARGVEGFESYDEGATIRNNGHWNAWDSSNIGYEGFGSYASGDSLNPEAYWAVSGETASATFKAKLVSGNKVGHFSDADATSSVNGIYTFEKPCSTALSWIKFRWVINSMGAVHNTFYAHVRNAAGSDVLHIVALGNDYMAVRVNDASTLSTYAYGDTLDFRIVFNTPTTFTCYLSVNGAPEVSYGPVNNKGTPVADITASAITDIRFNNGGWASVSEVVDAYIDDIKASWTTDGPDEGLTFTNAGGKGYFNKRTAGDATSYPTYSFNTAGPSDVGTWVELAVTPIAANSGTSTCEMGRLCGTAGDVLVILYMTSTQLQCQDGGTPRMLCTYTSGREYMIRIAIDSDPTKYTISVDGAVIGTYTTYAGNSFATYKPKQLYLVATTAYAYSYKLDDIVTSWAHGGPDAVYDFSPEGWFYKATPGAPTSWPTLMWDQPVGDGDRVSFDLTFEDWTVGGDALICLRSSDGTTQAHLYIDGTGTLSVLVYGTPDTHTTIGSIVLGTEYTFKYVFISSTQYELYLKGVKLGTYTTYNGQTAAVRGLQIRVDDTDGTGGFYIDDIAVTVLPTETFEGYTSGDPINGKAGPLGGYTTIDATGGSTATIETIDGQQRLQTVDASGSNSRVEWKLAFDDHGHPTGTTFRWEMAVNAIAGTGGILLMWYNGANPNVNLYLYNGHVYYHDGTSLTADSGLDYEADGTWHTWDIKFVDSDHFQIQKDGGGYTSDLHCRVVWGSSTTTIDGFWWYTQNGGTSDIEIDNIVH